jgi:hypothetical protein
MAWARKGTRRAWSQVKENELRKVGEEIPYKLVAIRSSQSRSILDNVWIGRKLYAFQVKRTDSLGGYGSVRSILKGIKDVVTIPDSVAICAVYHRRQHGRRGKHLHWRIFMTEEDYQKLRSWAGASVLAH